MQKDRFQSWAGNWIPKRWEDLGFSDSRDVVWPIVDAMKCGFIDGYPKSDQWYAVAFDSDEQARICKLLNQACEKEDT